MTFEPYYISDDVVQSLSALGRQDRIKIAKQFNVSEEHVRLIVKSECKVNENSAKILAACILVVDERNESLKSA